jgi:hypothetical protein
MRTITTKPSQVLAVDHDLVVWLGDNPASPRHPIVHLTTVSTGVDRTVAAAPNLVPTGDQWSVSPDGTTVASVWWTTLASANANGTYTPAFINVATGSVTVAPVAVPAPSPNTLEWANAGDRVFLIANLDSPDPGILTYQLGAHSIGQLRLHNAAVVASAVLLPSNSPARS